MENAERALLVLVGLSAGAGFAWMYFGRKNDKKLTTAVAKVKSEAEKSTWDAIQSEVKDYLAWGEQYGYTPGQLLEILNDPNNA